jgi:polyhydroxyalkanoate synthesis regulator phasin
MEGLKDVLYAGLGLAKQTGDHVKEKYDVLVEKGKKVDEEKQHIVRDLLKLLEEGKEKLGTVYDDQLMKVEEFVANLKR